MTDGEFVTTLQDLQAKGKDGLEEMRAVLRDNGGMKRLLAIAAQTVPKPKAGRVDIKAKTRIPDGFPGQEDKDRAVVYWERKRRPDLVANIEDIAERFYNHHLGAGTRSEKWSASWQTWYSNQIEFVRPPRDGDLFVASVTPLVENTNLDGWVGRLECFYGDTEAPAGTWSPKWGGKPPSTPTEAVPENCSCPTQAFALYLEQRKRRA